MLAVLPGHHHLGAEDRPLGQSLAGRHGGALLPANCHEDVIDVRDPLSFSLLASSAPLVAVGSDRAVCERYTHTLVHRTVSVSVSLPYDTLDVTEEEERSGPSGAEDERTEPNKEVRCQLLRTERHGESATTARGRPSARSVLLPRLPRQPPEQHFSFHLKHRFVTLCATSSRGAWLQSLRGRPADLRSGGDFTRGGGQEPTAGSHAPLGR